MRHIGFFSFWIYPPGAAALIYFAAAAEPGRGLFELCWLVPLGLVAWSGIEYCLHRYLFHLKTRNAKLRELVNALHGSHHASPRDPDRILVLPVYSLPISALLLAALTIALGSFFSAAGMMTGVWLGFLYYEAVHYRVHLSLSARGFLDAQRRHHFHHHFVDDAACFGVTSPLWDLVFGTFKPIR